MTLYTVCLCTFCMLQVLNEWNLGFRPSFLNSQSCNKLTWTACRTMVQYRPGLWGFLFLSSLSCMSSDTAAWRGLWCVCASVQARTRKSIATSATFHHHREPLACMPGPFPAPCACCPTQSPVTVLRSQCVPSPTHCDGDPPVLCLQSNLGDGAISHKVQPVSAEGRKVRSSLLIAYLSMR